MIFIFLLFEGSQGLIVTFSYVSAVLALQNYSIICKVLWDCKVMRKILCSSIYDGIGRVQGNSGNADNY